MIRGVGIAYKNDDTMRNFCSQRDNRRDAQISTSTLAADPIALVQPPRSRSENSSSHSHRATDASGSSTTDNAPRSWLPLNIRRQHAHVHLEVIGQLTNHLSTE